MLYLTKITIVSLLNINLLAKMIRKLNHKIIKQNIEIRSN
jgi:hypothetical protein